MPYDIFTLNKLIKKITKKFLHGAKITNTISCIVPVTNNE